MTDSDMFEAADVETATSEARRRLPLNVGSNLLYFAVAMGVGLWQIPYLIRHLGVAGYGQIGVLRSIVNYAALATFAVTCTVGRFTSIHIGRKNVNALNTTFNTALATVAVIGGCILAAAFVLAPHVAQWIHPPAGLAVNARQLFVLLVAASCVNGLGSPFFSIPFARHRFDWINAGRLLGMAAQVVVILGGTLLMAIGLPVVGWAYLLKEACVLIVVVAAARRLVPGLHLNPGDFDRRALKDMGSMSFWIIIDRVGFLLYFSIDLILINAFLGSEACGRYAPITQLAFLLNMFAVAVVTVFWPIAYQFIARRELPALVRHSQRTTRFMGLLLALPIGLLCGWASPVLRVWLGSEDWASAAPIVVLLLAPAAVSFSTRHLCSVFQGLNRSRTLAFTTLAGGLLNLGLSLLFLTFTELGVLGVALATCISLLFRYTVLVPLLSARLMNCPRHALFRGIPTSVASLLGVCVPAYTLSRFVDLSSFGLLVAAGAVFSVAYGIAVFAVALDADDIAFLRAFLPSHFRCESKQC